MKLEDNSENKMTTELRMYQGYRNEREELGLRVSPFKSVPHYKYWPTPSIGYGNTAETKISWSNNNFSETRFDFLHKFLGFGQGTAECVVSSVRGLMSDLTSMLVVRKFLYDPNHPYFETERILMG